MSQDFGRGPWYVAKLKNLVDDSTMTYVHSYAFKAASVMNVLHPEDRWITLCVTGPFDALKEAINGNPTHATFEWLAESEEFRDERVTVPQRVKMKHLQ